jgi:hypothetical protein
MPIRYRDEAGLARRVMGMPLWGGSTVAGLLVVALVAFSFMSATHDSIFLGPALVGIGIMLVQLLILTPVLLFRTSRLNGFDYELAPIAAALAPIALPVGLFVSLVILA